MGRSIEGKRTHRIGQADSCDVGKTFYVPKLCFVYLVIAADVPKSENKRGISQAAQAQSVVAKYNATNAL